MNTCACTYLTRQDLIQRGWSRHVIKERLMPDAIRRDSMSGNSVMLYAIHQVVRAESQDEEIIGYLERRRAETLLAAKNLAPSNRHPSNPTTIGEVANAYYGSHSGKSRSVCARMERAAAVGVVAAELYRAQKASSRAKVYRGKVSDNGPKYRDLAYTRKDDAIRAVTYALAEPGHDLTWGWGVDSAQPTYQDVLYIDLPTGQVSFHAAARYDGPDYPGEWDRTHASETRIIDFCQSVYSAAPEKPLRRKATAKSQ